MTTFLTKAFRNLMLLDNLKSCSSTQEERSLNNVAKKLLEYLFLTKELNSYLRNYARKSG